MLRRRALRAAAVFGVWTLFGLLIAEQTSLQLRLRGETRPLVSVLAPPLGGAWFWALYTPIVVAATRRLRRLRARGPAGWAACVAGHVALAGTLMVVGTTAWAWIRPLIDGVVSGWTTVFAYSILMDTTSYAAVVFLTEAATFAAAYRERDREAASLARTAAELQERLDEARLHALEAQLRPHFLYNTLNLVAELVHAEPDAADAMLTRLGLLLRRSYRASAHVVPLGDELAFVRAYAEILARRYRDRVALTVDVPDALHAVPVPAFALQPLVENAFRHGVERRESRTAVEIAGTVRDGALVLRVTDRATGAGRWETPPRRRRAPSDGGDGVGLRNTRERLRALYGGAASLTLDHDVGETTAVLRVPTTAPADLPTIPATRELAEVRP
ncbi:histidine kinase internal region [Gemmatirosa kalamazoonensis]|uniref:Histidine kinase internal region n=1 Tax=Gemmatirosa kalamazoonensis TaxID=861299 RepID=W0RB08_9BACT|nr:histidine kinase [Gemmatirosa kalamazoonensis]AHG88264.1 histidine kinase internal region [Gemmatirosa kalamazoonensis]